MIDPTSDDIGRKVIYRGYGGEIEEGVLSSFNSDFLFIRFGASCTAQACSNDERIEWVHQSAAPNPNPELERRDGQR